MELCLATVSDTVWFTPALFVMLALTGLLWEVTRQKSGVQLCGPVPRPPGESLNVDLSALNEKLVFRFLITISLAVVTGIAATLVAERTSFSLVSAVMFTGSSIALALTLWTWKAATHWRRSHSEFQAERMVGRQLNLLMLDGCRVFHDLAEKKLGNIDHIIVAPHAVFVVETMTPQDRKTGSGQNDHRVVSNANELRFPNFTTTDPLKKAARNAKWLEKHLEQRTGIKLPVRPIVTIPGWRVRRTNAGRVSVLNLDEIPQVVVDKAATPLYEAQRQRIITVLDERCQYTPC